MSAFALCRILQRPTLLLIPLLFSAFASVTHAGNRSLADYQSIIVRNPFQLHPPKPYEKPIPPPPPKQPEPEFFLTGITTIGYPAAPKRAYLIKKDPDPKHTTTFLTLSLGDKSSEPRLLEIDPKGRRIKINFHGADLWLSMKENAITSANLPPAPASTRGAFAHNIPRSLPAVPRLN
jgi:hypothetical protein